MCMKPWSRATRWSFMRSFWSHRCRRCSIFETCSAPGSANNPCVGKFCKAPIFFDKNGIRRISMGNLLLRQRDQLLGDQDPTLDVLERYGCPSIKIPPCFAKRMGMTGVATSRRLLYTKNFFPGHGTHQPYRNFCHERFVYSYSSCSRNLSFCHDEFVMTNLSWRICHDDLSWRFD